MCVRQLAGCDGYDPYTTAYLTNLIVHIEKSQVVAARSEEVLSSRVSVYDLILWPIEDGVVNGEHCCNT